MNRITKQWIERAEYDLVTGGSLLKSGRYLYVAFMCQQCVEKLIKAYFTNLEKSPPLIHNLLRLAEEANLTPNMNDDQKNFLADLNPFYIKARYGEYKDDLSRICDEKRAKCLLTQTTEFVKWLKPEIK